MKDQEINPQDQIQEKAEENKEEKKEENKANDELDVEDLQI